MIPGPELDIITPPKDSQNTVTGNTAATVETVDLSPSLPEPCSWTSCQEPDTFQSVLILVRNSVL